MTVSIVEMSIEDLEGRLNVRAHYWQGVLRLMDWNVKVVLKRSHEMKHPHALGMNSWDMNRKASVITMCSPEDLAAHNEAFDGEENDYDVTLVHELLHLHFAPFWPTNEDAGVDELPMEQAINLLSYALVALDRKEIVEPQVSEETVEAEKATPTQPIGAYI